MIWKGADDISNSVRETKNLDTGKKYLVSRLDRVRRKQSWKTGLIYWDFSVNRDFLEVLRLDVWREKKESVSGCRHGIPKQKIRIINKASYKRIKN